MASPDEKHDDGGSARRDFSGHRQSVAFGGKRQSCFWRNLGKLRARLELLDLNWPLIDAIDDALGTLERDPLAGHELRGRLRGLRSLRVGAYRIIYQLADNEQTVSVAAIRHRSIAY